MQPVFLFDIDGTLLSLKKHFSRPFILKCLKSCGLNLTEVNQADFAGRTDRDIFSSLTAGHPDAEDMYDELKSTYIRLLDEELEPGHVDVYKGARESLEYCTEHGIQAALLTGNYRESAFIKLNRAGLDGFFSFGSFGCDHSNRNLLGEYALESAETWFGRKTDPSLMVIIGDTPRDIVCARHSGFHAIAVATGHFPADELSLCNPDVVLGSLEKPELWIPSCLEKINGQ
jgi:phosphoglycolate phosphatase